MKTLARWVPRLYPEAWRLRYAVELEALLEDVGPGAGDLWDLARGALFMQMTNVSFWKIVAGCAVAGTLAAGIVAATLPDRYVSTAVIRIQAAPPEGQIQLMRLQQSALSRTSLTSIITAQHLYTNERKKGPLEDIAIVRKDNLFSRELNRGDINDATRKMRDSIRVRKVQAGLTADAFEISVQYPGRFQARQATRDLVARFTLAPQSATEVLDSASDPNGPAYPNRMTIVLLATAAGILLGLAASRLRRPTPTAA